MQLVLIYPSYPLSHIHTAQPYTVRLTSMQCISMYRTNCTDKKHPIQFNSTHTHRTDTRGDSFLSDTTRTNHIGIQLWCFSTQRGTAEMGRTDAREQSNTDECVLSMFVFCMYAWCRLCSKVKPTTISCTYLDMRNYAYIFTAHTTLMMIMMMIG